MSKTNTTPNQNKPVSFRPSLDVVNLLDAVRAANPNRSIRELFEEAFRHYHTSGPGALATVADLQERVAALEG